MKDTTINKKAEEILSKYDIKTLGDDKKIIEILDDLMNQEIITKEDEKMLSDIDNYLHIKSKILESTVAYSYLKQLSKRIEIQKIRKEDGIAYQVSLFKVKDVKGNDHLSLTREYLNDKIKNNKDLFGSSYNIEIVSQENTELYELLEVIKKMF